MPRRAGADGERGTIRRRGNSFQVRVRAGIDPVTGKELVLTGSAPTEHEAKDVRRRLLVQLADEMHARSKASFRSAMEKWLRVHEIDDSTRESYERYDVRRPGSTDRPVLAGWGKADMATRLVRWRARGPQARP